MEYAVFIEESVAVLSIFPLFKPILEAGEDGNRLDT